MTSSRWPEGCLEEKDLGRILGDNFRDLLRDLERFGDISPLKVDLEGVGKGISGVVEVIRESHPRSSGVAEG